MSIVGLLCLLSRYRYPKSEKIEHVCEMCYQTALCMEERRHAPPSTSVLGLRPFKEKIPGSPAERCFLQNLLMWRWSRPLTFWIKCHHFTFSTPSDCVKFPESVYKLNVSEDVLAEGSLTLTPGHLILLRPSWSPSGRLWLDFKKFARGLSVILCPQMDAHTI